MNIHNDSKPTREPKTNDKIIKPRFLNPHQQKLASCLPCLLKISSSIRKGFLTIHHPCSSFFMWLFNQCRRDWYCWLPAIGNKRNICKILRKLFALFKKYVNIYIYIYMIKIRLRETHINVCQITNLVLQLWGKVQIGHSTINCVNLISNFEEQVNFVLRHVWLIVM